jgi:hypothetical protein
MPEPILIEIATALAGKTAGSLYDMVKHKFVNRREASTTLDIAQGAPANSPEVLALAHELAVAEAGDPRFGEELRAHWVGIQAEAAVSDNGVANTIGGSVSGNVVQAREIHGNITFGV